MIVSLEFHLCTLIPITSILELSSVMCLALFSVEEPDGEKDLNMLKHSGPKAALPFCDNDQKKTPFPGHYLFILHFPSLPGGARTGWIPWEAWRDWRAGRWELSHDPWYRNE